MSDIERFGEFDGIQMGVMSDGTPFLTGRGLAYLCGVSPTTIFDWGQHVNADTPRWRKMSALLEEREYFDKEIFQVLNEHPQQPNAYPEQVCLAFLEYYAYEAAENNRTDKAKDIFRKLAGKTFRDFVYALVGYKRQQLTFSEYMLSRITHHHSAVTNPLPDGYFCLFDKMIEILQKFDLRIGYDLGETWYDTRHQEQRFLEPDISLGLHFSKLFTSNFEKICSKYQFEYEQRLNNPRIKVLWSEKLKNLKWDCDKAYAEQEIRRKYGELFELSDHNGCPIPENLIDRKLYNFRPAPDSGRPDDLPPAFCYTNNYTSMFYDWLRNVFFKYVWRDYILERDPDNWMRRYNQFQLMDDVHKRSILTTTEGNLIQGFEYRDIWERQLSSGD